MNQAERSAKIDELINTFAEAYGESVQVIEAGPEITQGHYGSYMALIGSAIDGIKDHKKQTAQLVSMALLKAGANQRGIMSAMSAHGFR